ncbi:MAG TPA: hypothetical protein DEQ14_02165 [Treponema sp.]|nr:hypothetical protein [Treponema sp.]
MNLDCLLQDYKLWKNTNEYFTAFDYLGLKCNSEQIFTVSKLFFPDVSIVADCFFLNDSRQKTEFDVFWKNAVTAADLEKVMNFVCLNNIVKSEADDNFFINKEIITIMKQSWEMYFSKKYKNLNLIIEDYEDKYDGWSITVYQRDNLTRAKPCIDNLSIYFNRSKT